MKLPRPRGRTTCYKAKKKHTEHMKRVNRIQAGREGITK